MPVADRIVHGRDLGWILVILLDDGTAGEIADGDDVVSVIHPVHLDTEYRGVHIATTAVEVRGVDRVRCRGLPVICLAWIPAG